MYVIAYVYGVRLTISSIILAEIVIGAAVGIKIIKKEIIYESFNSCVTTKDK